MANPLRSYKSTCPVCNYVYNPVLSGCPECNHEKNKQYIDSHSTVWVDRNLGFYDHQLGVYVESTHHLRHLMKERGLEGVNSFSEANQAKEKNEAQQLKEDHSRLKQTILKGSADRRTIKLAS